jgi:hypothetical protein
MWCISYVLAKRRFFAVAQNDRKRLRMTGGEEDLRFGKR